MAAGDFKVRRGDPDMRIDYTDTEGNQKHMTTGSDGRITPKNALEDSILTNFGFTEAQDQSATSGKKRSSKRSSRSRASTAEAPAAAPSPEPQPAPVDETGANE